MSKDKKERFSEKQKRQIVAITRKLKEQKGITIKPSEVDHDLKDLKETIKKIDSIKEEFKDTPAVVEEADKGKKRLMKIISDMNEYMAVLHPEGLLDYGSGSGGKVMGQG